MALKFKSGDPVRFLNDVGGGVVSRVDADGLVYVQTTDGFEIPISAGELVYARSFDISVHAEPEVVPEVKVSKPVKARDNEPRRPAMNQKLPSNIPADAATDLYLGFIPEDQGPVFNSELACYLINDSPYFAYYSVGSREQGNYYHVASGLIESHTKSLLTVFSQTAISKISAMHVQLIWISQGRYSRKIPLDVLADIRLVNFSKESYYRENPFFDENAILFPVTGKDELNDPLARIEVTESAMTSKTEGDEGQEIKAKKKEKPSDTMEIDLHMDEQDLQKSQFSLSGILALQMSRFHSAMEEAISKKFRRLVIIHGVGQGTLKMQIRKELQEKYPNFLFQDASFREYGFGATMVHLIPDKKQ